MTQDVTTPVQIEAGRAEKERLQRLVSLVQNMLVVHNVVGDDPEGAFQSCLDELDEWLVAEPLSYFGKGEARGEPS